jgi:hypothetical protein
LDPHEKAKIIAVRRAQWRLKQRLETIDYERELKKELEELAAGEVVLEITVESES